MISKSKSTRDILPIENKDKNLLYISQGGIINKPIAGYSFGIVKGKLNLIKTREHLLLERNKDILESIGGDCTLNKKNTTIRTRGDDYFEEAALRKSDIQKKRIIERSLKLDKISKMHKSNLDKIAAEKEAEQKNIR